MALKPRILIADNDDANVQLLTDICLAEDLAVLVAKDGDETLHRIHTDNPDLVLLDVMMPMRDGFEVLQALREEPLTRTLPVILVTAVSDDDSIRQGYQLGANDYITKPFKVAELVSRMHSLIHAAAYQRMTQGMSGWIVGDADSLMTALRGGVQAPASLLLFRMLNMDHLEETHNRTAALHAAQQMTYRLRMQVRGVDSAYLLEPGLVAILLGDTGPDGATTAARRLEQAFEKPIQLGGKELHLRCVWASASNEDDAEDDAEDDDEDDDASGLLDACLRQLQEP
jgi:DNA-binding response OmpR family regulator